MRSSNRSDYLIWILVLPIGLSAGASYAFPSGERFGLLYTISEVYPLLIPLIVHLWMTLRMTHRIEKLTRESWRQELMLTELEIAREFLDGMGSG